MGLILCKRCGINFVEETEEYCAYCKPYIKPLPPLTPTQIDPREEADLIKQFLQERHIEYLVHFTNSKNVNSILYHGLLSKLKLKERNIQYFDNDSKRLDNLLDYICLSITTPNQYLLNAFKKNGSIDKASILYIDASVLYKEITTDRIYVDRNAATSYHNCGSHLDNLKLLFVEKLSYTTFNNSFNYNRIIDGRAINEPTDLQAEILFKGKISSKYIIDIEEIS